MVATAKFFGIASNLHNTAFLPGMVQTITRLEGVETLARGLTMATLEELRKDWEAARVVFAATVATKFPGCSEWHWHRAHAHIKGQVGRWNDDTSNDAALVADAEIQAAWDDYIAKLHAFYRFRDGPGGVLGGRIGK